MIESGWVGSEVRLLQDFLKNTLLLNVSKIKLFFFFFQFKSIFCLLFTLIFCVFFMGWKPLAFVLGHCFIVFGVCFVFKSVIMLWICCIGISISLQIVTVRAWQVRYNDHSWSSWIIYVSLKMYCCETLQPFS